MKKKIVATRWRLWSQKSYAYILRDPYISFVHASFVVRGCNDSAVCMSTLPVYSVYEPPARMALVNSPQLQIPRHYYSIHVWLPSSVTSSSLGPSDLPAPLTPLQSTHSPLCPHAHLSPAHAFSLSITVRFSLLSTAPCTARQQQSRLSNSHVTAAFGYVGLDSIWEGRIKVRSSLPSSPNSGLNPNTPKSWRPLMATPAHVYMLAIPAAPTPCTAIEDRK